jgi:hypothetical protein
LEEVAVEAAAEEEGEEEEAVELQEGCNIHNGCLYLVNIQLPMYNQNQNYLHTMCC